MSTKQQYHAIYHLERLFHYVADNCDRDDRIRYQGSIIHQLNNADPDIYEEALESLSWRDEPMTGWVNNRRRMRFDRLHASRQAQP